MWFSVAKFKYSVFKNLLQNSNFPTCFQMWCWLSAFCWRSCQCWVAIMEVGQDLYTKCSTLHISRKCKPALFSQKQKKTFVFIFGQDMYNKFSTFHISRTCKLAHNSRDFFVRICVYTKWPMLHFILRKIILSSTYDDLLAMRLDS